MKVSTLMNNLEDMGVNRVVVVEVDARRYDIVGVVKEGGEYARIILGASRLMVGAEGGEGAKDAPDKDA